eukprot:5011756-Amphidinium_carterae.1
MVASKTSPTFTVTLADTDAKGIRKATKRTTMPARTMLLNLHPGLQLEWKTSHKIKSNAPLTFEAGGWVRWNAVWS